jgi:solute carrier family 25 uncoupling protein 8/9
VLQVRNFYTGKDFKGDPPLLTKIAAGLTTGAIGIMVASPTDLVKVYLSCLGHSQPCLASRSASQQTAG